MNLKLPSFLRLPPTESQYAVALGLCAVVSGALLCAVVWQANVIAEQREALRYLWKLCVEH